MQSQSRSTTFVRTGAAYGAWLLTIALGLAVIWVWRSALLGLFIVMRFDKYAYAAYNNVVVLALALGWLVMVIATEGIFRTAAGRRRLRALAIRLDGALAALAIVGFVLVQFVL